MKCMCAVQYVSHRQKYHYVNARAIINNMKCLLKIILLNSHR